MNSPQTLKADYLTSLLTDQPYLSASPLTYLNALRAKAIDRVSALTVPTLRDEEWRFTDISMLIKTPFKPVREATELKAIDIKHFHIEEAITRLVFIDGIYAPHLSSEQKIKGISVTHLKADHSLHTATIEAHLGRHIKFNENAFAALNTAFLNDAALILVSRDTKVTEPIHALFIATQKDTANYPRLLLLSESNSKATIVEDYVSLQDGPYFTNSVTEIVLLDNAHINHIRVQRESTKAFHIANCAVSLDRASNYQSVSVAFGSRISRYNLNLRLDEQSECAVDGLALISERQLADTHTFIDHAKPHAVSRQMHKCIVGGSAHAVFNGQIMVRQNAQRTDSKQSSRNLLLTNKARIDTKPQLEIFADDVKCTHGATIGQLDKEEVFYLQSRGLSELAARNMLTYAFGAEIIERIPIPSLKLTLEKTVLEQTTIQS